ncbi:hypothetical protein [Dyella mobilis]|uniref:N-acetyltransferase domain-containing protein n=1 Tax=Dyella mobilis TaxID=1849582 RepID=A0ABS2KFR0_9GAMM|nr:hypothetical protein [Dyella mobilis]MBM7129929.1 hypothetical protein [Dyella mobilis]GLQ97808.1 hypothetical protein GCM10007863_22280 [Dyella mobilis]
MSRTDADAVSNIDRFQVHWVFGRIDEALRQRIVAFWLNEQALISADEAWRRSAEVACVLLEGEQQVIAGICTVAIQLDDDGRSYGFVRIFIRAQSRVPGLARRMIRRMAEGFRVLAREPGAPQRLVLTIENRKLARHGAQRVLGQLGFVDIGVAANGERVMERRLTP